MQSSQLNCASQKIAAAFRPDEGVVPRKCWCRLQFLAMLPKEQMNEQMNQWTNKIKIPNEQMMQTN